ncbi:MAG: glycosyl transferase, group 1 [Rhodospirillaceae bacterium]|nr:glycosyl transferase, group 1 [Rhodospirillaceae bacterium]
MVELENSTRPNCAIIYHPDGFHADREQVKGRHSAGAGFLKGFVDHSGVDKFVAVTAAKADFEDFEQLVGALDPKGRPRVWARVHDRHLLAQTGTLFVPGPGLEAEAWNRRYGNERDYSLCGVTHTVASDRVIAGLSRYLVAPTQPWDALVCTSTSVRQVVERIIGHGAEYLGERFGVAVSNPVRLPVIPLGVDCDHYAPGITGADARASLRKRLGIENGDVAALFLGRLSFHAKAHPTPMFIAAERAARRWPDGKLHVLLVGQFPNHWIEKEFHAAAKRFCEVAQVHVLDGSDNDIVHASWRAADLFLSLSDNIQESFGLTPIEAMAAGLPCIVSDWNGYKDTVVDGETGFRVQTLAPGGGTGVDLADRYALGLDTYDRFIGATSLSTVTDIEGCAEALHRLCADNELRAHQSAAAIARARSSYDWRVVVHAYQELWSELAELRCSAQGLSIRDHTDQSARNDFPDPFDMFQGHPTSLLQPDTLVCLKSPDPIGDIAQFREGELHTFVAHAFLSDAETDAILTGLCDGPRKVSSFDAFERDRRKCMRTLLWLGKFDLVEFQ